MQYTTNYNLNIVEGTDIVNPMSVDNPNYSTIDSVMYANECNAIGSATELKSGTVHALTRVKANQNVFRFRATARYVAGDTFTVDGNVVTAQLPDGSALADGAYIIGSDVLCALVGSQLTLFVSINNGEQIMYDQNTSVNQKIDDVASDVSSATSIKSSTNTNGSDYSTYVENTYSSTAREINHIISIHLVFSLNAVPASSGYKEIYKLPTTITKPLENTAVFTVTSSGDVRQIRIATDGSITMLADKATTAYDIISAEINYIA